MEHVGTHLPDPSYEGLALTRNSILKKNIDKCRASEILIIWEVNGVAMAHHGPILYQNEAHRLQEGF